MAIRPFGRPCLTAWEQWPYRHSAPERPCSRSRSARSPDSCYRNLRYDPLERGSKTGDNDPGRSRISSHALILGVEQVLDADCGIDCSELVPEIRERRNE